MTRYCLALILVLFVPAFQGCEPSCEDARGRMIELINIACEEEAFSNNPVCSTCRERKYYSIDDTCTCRVLNFDKDQCYYADSKEAGLPDVREALLHAEDVCADREVTFPDEGAGGASEMESE